MKPHDSLSHGKVRLILDSIEGWQDIALRHERMAEYEKERGDDGAVAVQHSKARLARATALALLFELYDGKHRCTCCGLVDPLPGHKKDYQFEARAQVRWAEILELEDKAVDVRAFLLKTIHAPWTPAQVEALNLYQTKGCMHPFTGDRGPGGEERVLLATPSGWVEVEGGPVVQTWAWRRMAGMEEGEPLPSPPVSPDKKPEGRHP